jgi:hypothetical protein
MEGTDWHWLIGRRFTKSGEVETETFRHSEEETAGLWRRLSARWDDSFEIEFCHVLSPSRDWFLGPIACIELHGDPHTEIGIQFFIEDQTIVQWIEKFFPDGALTDGTTLSIKFFQPGKSFRDLAGRFAVKGPWYAFRQSLQVTLGIKSATRTIVSGVLHGGALIAALGKEEGKNFFIFDCHSHWKLFPVHTECHGWSCSSWSVPPQTCGCVQTDLTNPLAPPTFQTSCTLWRCCFCDCLGRPILA